MVNTKFAIGIVKLDDMFDWLTSGETLRNDKELDNFIGLCNPKRIRYERKSDGIPSLRCQENHLRVGLQTSILCVHFLSL